VVILFFSTFHDEAIPFADELIKVDKKKEVIFFQKAVNIYFLSFVRNVRLLMVIM
jgi:hypothetical protein